MDQHLCHVCGEPGTLILTNTAEGAIYGCRTAVCDVVHFDSVGTRRRELPPRG